MGRKKKKPQSTMEVVKTIVEILTNIATIVLIVHTILGG